MATAKKTNSGLFLIIGTALGFGIAKIFSKKNDSVNGLEGVHKKMLRLGRSVFSRGSIRFEYSGHMYAPHVEIADSIADNSRSIREAWDKVVDLKYSDKSAYNDIHENGTFILY